MGNSGCDETAPISSSGSNYRRWQGSIGCAGANWHSVLEQMHGFGHGLAIAIAMAILWRHQPMEEREKNDRGWTLAFSAAFVLFGIGFLNLHKLVETWVANQSVPATHKTPFFSLVEASPHVWFRVVWWSATAVGAILLLIRLRRRLD